MLYCPKCNRLTSGPCQRCGRKLKKLRAPGPYDQVYLLNCRFQYASMIEPLLADNSIPYSRIGSLGAALSTAFGSMLELYNIYVPYAYYPSAYELISGIFGNDGDVMGRLENYGMTDAEIANMLPEEIVELVRNLRGTSGIAEAYNSLLRACNAETAPYFHWILDNLELHEDFSIVDIGCNGDIWAARPLPDRMLIKPLQPG